MRIDTDTDPGILDEAFERFHRTGPEFDDGLSNHGPMVVEAMVRHGHGKQVHGWIDWYQDRLEDVPRGITPVTASDWREALGDPHRLGDWTTFMVREVGLRPWRDVLAAWWPRLLPGIAAGATHGVIRVGHAVRALLDNESGHSETGHSETGRSETGHSGSAPSGVWHSTTPPSAAPSELRLVEFAHALAYWAARWSSFAGNASARDGHISPGAALAAVPSVAEQRISISHRLGQLADTPGWHGALGDLRSPDSPEQAAAQLAELVNAAVLDYRIHGHANPVMLVHASTAPTAVLRTLPALPTGLWIPSLDAAWHATAAVTAAYRNTAAPEEELAGLSTRGGSAEEAFARAVEHGNEHAVKFADAAIDVFGRTEDGHALAAIHRATQLIQSR